MSRRITVIVAGAALAVAGGAAVAAPAHATTPHDATAAQPFSVVCPAGQHASVTLPIDGAYVVGSLDDSADVLDPYRFDYRWTDARGHVLIRSEAQGETGPVPPAAVTCRTEPITYPDGTVLSVTVTAVIRPTQ